MHLWINLKLIIEIYFLFLYETRDTLNREALFRKKLYKYGFKILITILKCTIFNNKKLIIRKLEIILL